MFFDAHSDIWCDVTTRRLRGETDILRKHHLPRLRKGGVEGSILVIWVDPPYDKDYGKRTQQIMTCVDAEVKECDEIQIVHTYDEMMQANKAGKIYIFKGILVAVLLVCEVHMVEINSSIRYFHHRILRISNISLLVKNLSNSSCTRCTH